jgi:ethanolamine utilization protein EutQ
MTEVKLFRRADQDLEPGAEGAAVRGLVNKGFSERLGAGIGVFRDCAVEWTVTYDEVLFILEGTFRLRVGGEVYHAGPGDTLWIPKDTALVYEADAPVTFFYAVSPVEASPSTGEVKTYPTAPPGATT